MIFDNHVLYMEKDNILTGRGYLNPRVSCLIFSPSSLLIKQIPYIYIYTRFLITIDLNTKGFTFSHCVTKDEAMFR